MSRMRIVVFLVMLPLSLVACGKSPEQKAAPDKIIEISEVEKTREGAHKKVSPSQKIPKVSKGNIEIDGRIGDWKNIEFLSENVGSEVRLEYDFMLDRMVKPKDIADIKSVKAAYDDEHLFFLLQVEQPVGNIAIFVDSDGNASTGEKDAIALTKGKGHRFNLPHGWDYAIQLKFSNIIAGSRIMPLVVCRVTEARAKDAFKEFVKASAEHIRVLRAFVKEDEAAFKKMEKKLRESGRNNLDDPAYISLNRMYEFLEMKIPLSELGIEPPAEPIFLFVEDAAGIATDFDKYCQLVRATMPATQAGPGTEQSLKKKETDRPRNAVSDCRQCKFINRGGRQEGLALTDKQINPALHMADVQGSLYLLEKEIRAAKRQGFLDRIIFTNGKEIQCEILSETSDSVSIRTDIGNATIPKSQISYLSGGTKESKEKAAKLESEIEELRQKKAELESAGRERQRAAREKLGRLCKRHGWNGLLVKIANGDADIDRRNDNGYSALTQAVKDGRKQVVRVLLESGADVNAKSYSGWTALMVASYDGKIDLVGILLKHAADPNAESKLGQTALMLVAKRGKSELVMLPIDKVADADVIGKEGGYAFVQVVGVDYCAIVRMLLEMGADVNAGDRYGDTALILSAKRGRIDIAEVVLDKGADVNAKNKKGATALSLASAKGHKKVVKLLREAGAKE